MPNRRLAFLLTVLLIPSGRVFTQGAPPANSLFSAPGDPSSRDVSETRTETFSARVREVNLLFSATDWRGRFVSNLTTADIRVLDNGLQPQSLTYFLRQSDLPLRVGLLIDVSGSVETFFKDQQKAAAIFLKETIRPSDSAAIITFGRESRVVQDFTSSLQSLTDSVQTLSAGESATAIYDAVGSSCAKLSSVPEAGLARRVLILITDGEENSSHSRIENAIDATLQSDVIVFALNTNRSQQLTDPMLQKLSKSTGGAVLHAHGAHELKAAFRRINEQLRSQYLVGYKPPQWKADQSFHKIRITTQRFGLRLHCRKGYYASE